MTGIDRDAADALVREWFPLMPRTSREGRVAAILALVQPADGIVLTHGEAALAAEACNIASLQSTRRDQRTIDMSWLGQRLELESGL